MKKSNRIKRLLSVRDTAAYLGDISERTIYNGIAPKAKNKFPIRPIRIGKSIRFDIEDLDRFIESQKI